MVDFVKLKLPCTAGKLRMFLATKGYIIYQRGYNKEYVAIENLEIQLYAEDVLLVGSLHKFYNIISGRGSQNYDDFTQEMVKDCVNYLSRLLNLDVWDSSIQNLEYGLNVPIASDKVLPIIISCKGKEKSLDRRHSGGGRTIEFEHAQFYYKIYDKSAQHRLKRPLTRVEIKVMKGQYLQRKFGFSILRDLLSEKNLFELKKDLLIRTEEILMANAPSDIESFDEEKLYREGFNPRYWSNLKYTTVKQSHIFRRKWNEFKVYVASKGLDKIQRQLLHLIDRKWSALLLGKTRKQPRGLSSAIHFLHLGKEEVVKWGKFIKRSIQDVRAIMRGYANMNSP